MTILKIQKVGQSFSGQFHFCYLSPYFSLLIAYELTAIIQQSKVKPLKKA